MLKRLADANVARAVVLAIYGLSYFAGLSILLWGQPYADYKPNQLVDLFLAVYAVPLSIVTVGALAKKSTAVTLDPVKLVLLYGSAILWNAFVLYGIYRYFQSFTTVAATGATGSDLNGVLTLAKDKIAFVITGILTYVYASADNKTRQNGQEAPDVSASNTNTGAGEDSGK